MEYRTKKPGPRTSLFQRHVKGNRILDLGFAGSGEASGVQHKIIRIIKPQASVVGLDIELDSIKASGFRDTVVAGNGYFLPFKKDVFDQVIMSEVIEHLWNPKSVLEEIHRVLAVNGEILLTTPHVYSLQKLFHYLLGENEMGFSDHKILYSISSISNLLNNSGFKIESAEILKLVLGIPRTRIRVTMRKGIYPFSRFGSFLFIVAKKIEKKDN